MSQLKFTPPQPPYRARRKGLAKTNDGAHKPASEAPRSNKTDTLIALLRRPEGATMDDLMAATSWQRHSVRGALAGAVRKKIGQPVASLLVDGVRRYAVPEVSE